MPALLPLLLPLAVIAVPFVDLLLAVVRRTRAGRSPFAPDKQHLHHRLLEMGHSQRRAVLVMYAGTALLAFGTVALALVPVSWALLFLTLGAIGLALVVRWPPVGGRACCALSRAEPSEVLRPGTGIGPSTGAVIASACEFLVGENVPSFASRTTRGDLLQRICPGRIGALNATCWLAGIALGWVLDSRLHTVPLFIWLGLVTGAALGVVATSNEVRRYLGE